MLRNGSGGGVDTAWSRRRDEVDSSDEESEREGEYKEARRKLEKETRKLEGAYSGKEKGKGKAVPQ